MWWVAWRQHRLAVLIALAVMVVVAAATLIFQLVLIARMHAAGCTVLTDSATCPTPAVQNAFDENTWHLLRGVLVATPIVLGVFVGAPMFPREFEQHTHVLALTQSVGRLRWWAAKVTVAGVPLLVGLLGLGFLQQWCDATTWFTSGADLYDGTFQVRSIMPAAFGLLAFAIAVTAGLFIRSVTAALVAVLVVAGAGVILIAFPLRPHLLPATRQITSVPSAQLGPAAVAAYNRAMQGTWFLGSGILLNGKAIPFYQANDVPCQNISMAVTNGQQPTAQQTADYNKALAKCQKDHGIQQYTDYLPASMLWPLRGIEAGICVLLAGLALAFGAVRLRSKAGSRS